MQSMFIRKAFKPDKHMQKSTLLKNVPKAPLWPGKHVFPALSLPSLCFITPTGACVTRRPVSASPVIILRAIKHLLEKIPSRGNGAETVLIKTDNSPARLWRHAPLHVKLQARVAAAPDRAGAPAKKHAQRVSRFFKS